MKYVNIKRLGVKVSRIALGTRQIPEMWPGVTEQSVIETWSYSLKRGINFIETADVYGSGAAERLVARVIRNMKIKPIICTKVGVDFSHIPFQKCFDPDYIYKATIESLNRLETNRIDILMLHNPPQTVFEKRAIWNRIDSLKEEGIIGAVGVALNTPTDGLIAINSGYVECIGIPYSIYYQEPRYELFDRAKEYDVPLIAREMLHGGLLTDRFISNGISSSIDPRTNVSGFGKKDIREFLTRLQPFATNYGSSISDLAIAFVLSEKRIDCGVMGVTSIDQADRNINALSKMISENDISEIHRIYDSGEY